MDPVIHQPGLTVLISQGSEYALRAVIYLAQRQGGLCPTQEVAEATKVPVGYLQKILRMLARAGLLVAQRGVGGGFALAKVPTSISVLDVLRAADSDVSRIERCPLGIKGHTSLCALHRLLDQEIAHAARTFSTTTIADLLESVDGVRPLCETKGGASLTIDGDARPNGAPAHRPPRTD
ncbi:MAG: RrF2 family transcriptional regulator [Phycisphaerales bacterium JB038]